MKGLRGRINKEGVIIPYRFCMVILFALFVLPSVGMDLWFNYKLYQRVKDV